MVVYIIVSEMQGHTNIKYLKLTGNRTILSRHDKKWMANFDTGSGSVNIWSSRRTDIMVLEEVAEENMMMINAFKEGEV